MPPFDGHYYYNDSNATPSSICPILEFLGKRKRERKVFDDDGDAPLVTLKFSRRKRRKTQGSNHLMFVTWW